jgi:hypothetical protein
MSARKPLVAHILAVPPNQPVFAERAAEMRFFGGFLGLGLIVPQAAQSLTAN